MNDYDLIAPFYDIEHAHFSEDLDMYNNFAELCGGRILELACGSGRVLLPLAQNGYELTGVDTSAGMLELAQLNLQKAQVAVRCKLVQQDMCELDLQQKFRLAFIALGSFGHLVTRKEQQRALAAIRAHLSPGGRLIIDISNTDANYMEDLGGQMLHLGTWYNEDNTCFTHFVSPTTATHKHLLELTHFYERHQQGGSVQRTTVATSLYLFGASELELLLEQAGFVVKDMCGDYDLSPFRLESPRMICIAEARQ